MSLPEILHYLLDRVEHATETAERETRAAVDQLAPDVPAIAGDIANLVKDVEALRSTIADMTADKQPAVPAATPTT